MARSLSVMLAIVDVLMLLVFVSVLLSSALAHDWPWVLLMAGGSGQFVVWRVEWWKQRRSRKRV